MSKHYQRKPGRPPDEQHLPAAERVNRAILRDLVTVYEAVRCQRGHERDAAARSLGLALSRYGRPFEMSGWVWCWCHTLDSITRARAAGAHQVHVAHEHEAGADLLPRSSSRRCGRAGGRGQAFGGWTIKGRSI